MKQPEDSEPCHPPGSRPPDYVLVVSASDWVRERFPGSAMSLDEASAERHGPLSRTRARPGSRTMTKTRKGPP